MVAAGPDEPKPFTYIGLFLTTLSLLQFELFLTRIFSVTMWYHFAFMAISLAMFGLAAGAIFVELMKKRSLGTTVLIADDLTDTMRAHSKRFKDMIDRSKA